MYYLAIVLPEHINKKVAHWKNYMLEKYNCKVGLKSPAHITIIPPFWMEEKEEDEFAKAVDDIAKDLAPFLLKPKTFSAYKHRPIFIDVATNEQLNEVKKKVDTYFQHHKNLPVKIDTRPFHPHITIATRDLFKKSFYEVWPLFEREKFEEEWTVNSLSILRHNKKNWDVFRTSQFQSVK